MSKILLTQFMKAPLSKRWEISHGTTKIQNKSHQALKISVKVRNGNFEKMLGVQSCKHFGCQRSKPTILASPFGCWKMQLGRTRSQRVGLVSHAPIVRGKALPDPKFWPLCIVADLKFLAGQINLEFLPTDLQEDNCQSLRSTWYTTLLSFV